MWGENSPSGSEMESDVITFPTPLFTAGERHQRLPNLSSRNAPSDGALLKPKVILRDSGRSCPALEHISQLGRHAPTGPLTISFPDEQTPTQETYPENQLGKGLSNSIIDQLFTGSSAPVHVSIIPQSSSQDHPVQMSSRKPAVTGRSHNRLLAKFTTSHIPCGKTSWFSSKPHSNQVIPEDPHDEMLNVDIKNSLFPKGPVDPLHPSSFNDLLFNAENLVSRLQAGYWTNKRTLCDVIAEKSTQKDELEEAETRVRHLKMQLEHMAAKASEQENAMKALLNELAFERLRHEEERGQRERSGSQKHSLLTRKPSSIDISDADRSDLRKRSNSGSVPSLADDSGCESGDDYSVESGVFPRTSNENLRYHTESETKASSWLATSELKSREATACPTHLTTSEITWEEAYQPLAWRVASDLREKNCRLQLRIEELEMAVGGCLDLVSGLKS